MRRAIAAGVFVSLVAGSLLGAPIANAAGSSEATPKKPPTWQTFKANRVKEAAPNRLMIPKVLPAVIEDARDTYAEWQEAWSNHLEYRKEARSPEPEPADPSSPAVTTYASSSVWDAVVACEASGNWGLVTTGNGYWFAMQFTSSTWLAYGGTQAELDAGVAPSPARLIEVAERVLAGQGPGAWPNCFP